MTTKKYLKYIGLTEGEEGVNFQSILNSHKNRKKSNLKMGIVLTLSVSIQKHMKQNNRSKWKSRIEMGKMAGTKMARL